MHTHLAREVRVEAAVAVNMGHGVEFRRDEAIDVGDTGLDGLAGVSDLGALVHILVQSIVSDREAKPMDEENEVRAGGTIL